MLRVIRWIGGVSVAGLFATTAATDWCCCAPFTFVIHLLAGLTHVHIASQFAPLRELMQYNSFLVFPKVLPSKRL